MHLALATLLISSVSWVGLLALWAATSSRHWFLRTVVFLGMVSLLLLIPAHEPWVTFLLQGAMVVVGLQAYRWRTWLEDEPEQGRRFSVATMLQLTTVFAVLITGGFRAYQDPWTDWTSVLAGGLSAGLITLVASWLVSGSMGWWKRVLVVILVSLLASLITIWWEPPIVGWVDLNVNPWGFGERVWQPLVWFLFTICLVVVFALFLVLHHKSWRNLLGILLLILLTPSAYVYYRLLTPTSIPEVVLPEPNGYFTLVDVGKEIGCREINDYSTTALTMLSQAVQQRSALYQQSENALRMGVAVPLIYSENVLDTEALRALRTLARALAARARVAAAKGDHALAANYCLQDIELGAKCARGGVLVHWLVGSAINGIGYSQLYELLPQLNAKQCLQLANSLEEFERTPNDYRQMLLRERVWCERAQGPYGHLALIVVDLAGIDFPGHLELDPPRLHDLAKSRLLRSELALRAYTGFEGEYPMTFAELVPKYLEDLPLDPFDSNGGPLRYRRDGDSYVLYSVGENGDDNGGVMEQDPNSYSSYHYTGDYRLDVAFAPDPNEVDPNADLMVE